MCLLCIYSLATCVCSSNKGKISVSELWFWNWRRLKGTMRQLVTQTGVSPRTICGCVCWDISPGPGRMQICVNNIISFSLWLKIHLYLCPTCFPHPWWGFWTPSFFFFNFAIYCRNSCNHHWCTRISPGHQAWFPNLLQIWLQSALMHKDLSNMLSSLEWYTLTIW